MNCDMDLKAIKERICNTHGLFIEEISKVSGAKLVDDILNKEKPREQIELFKKYTGEVDLKGKSLLEIGSGYGLFNVVARSEYGIDAWGIEPGSPGFDGSFEISLDILKANGLSTDKIVESVGELLPFPDCSFDYVYSTNVLEHVSDPAKVIREAIRVCRNNGIIQVVVPNFGSWFDGHYVCLYLPYQPKWLWKWWIKHVLRRDPSFVDTLRTEINYFTLKAWLKPFVTKDEIKVLDYGEGVFRNRMEKVNFTAYAGLGKVKRWVELLHWLRLDRAVTAAMIATKSFSPLILTIRKKT